MGLHQDRTGSQNTFKRLATLVVDEDGWKEIAEDEWPLAITVFALSVADREPDHERVFRTYGVFSSFCPGETRRTTLLQLADFIKRGQGKGWRALLLFALADEDQAIRREAATLAGTLATPDSSSPFAGFRKIVRLITQPALQGAQHPGPLLDSLLGTADLRLLELADSILNKIYDRDLEQLLQASLIQPNALSCEWLLHVLEQRPALSGAVTAVFETSAARSRTVVDAIVPIPSWAFRDASAQPLHGWTLPEFFERIRRRLARHLDDGQMQRIETAWCDVSKKD